MDGTKQTTNWIIAGLVALVVIIGGGWLIARERSSTLATDTASSTATASTSDTTDTEDGTVMTASPTARPSASPAAADQTASAMGETITVEDQAAGTSVVVANVKLSKPSFIAIRDTRGWYPGWQYVTASETDVTIPLKRGTEAGRTYEAVIFVDDGDGVLELHGGDMLVTSTQGAPVSTTFTAK